MFLGFEFTEQHFKNTNMKEVYCVFADYNHEGRELMEVFAKEEDADKMIEANKLYYHLVKEKWTVK